MMCLIIACRTLSNVPGRLQIMRQASNMRWLGVYFQSELNTMAFSSVPTENNLRMRVGLRACCTSKAQCSWSYSIVMWIFILVLVWRTRSCPRILDTPCMCCMILAIYGNHVNTQHLGIVFVMMKPQVYIGVKT